jgi:hypothetical protein
MNTTCWWRCDRCGEVGHVLHEEHANTKLYRALMAEFPHPPTSNDGGSEHG